MKIESTKIKVERSADFEEREITMSPKATAFILEMISSGIYSNPIGSIVRELASNCKDAHKQVNQTKDFEIEFVEKNRLTGKFENSIIFRDFGIGLDKTRIEDIYINVFESDKRESNDYIGAWGIGSKSPLAYTDSFNLITYVDGLKTTYQIQKTANDKIKLITLAEELCKEEVCKKTEVIIPIKESDVSTFKDEIVDQLHYFANVKYIGFTPDVVKLVYSSDTMVISDTLKVSDHIVIGEVKYPLDRKIVLGEKSYIYGRINSHIGYKFNIGELKVSTNRESIRYTVDTIAKIKAKISVAKKEAKKFLTNKFKTETNILQFLKDWYALNYNNSWLSSLYKISAFDNVFDFQDKSINLDYFDKCLNIRQVSIRDKKVVYKDYKLSSIFSQYDSLNIPKIYYSNEDLNAYKNRYLFKVNGNFFVIKFNSFEQTVEEDKDQTAEHLKENRDIYDYYVDLIKTSAQDYSAVVIDESKMTEDDRNTGLTTKQIRELNKTIFVKDCVKSGCYHQRMEFKHLDVKPDFLKTTTDLIIWGYNEQESRLKQIKHIICNIDRNVAKELDEIYVYKIAKNNESNIKQAKNQMFIEEVFNQKHDLLVKYYTAFKIKLVINEYDYLQCFSEFNSDIFNKYESLVKFTETYYQPDMRGDNEFKETLLAWMESGEVYDKAIINTLTEVQTYCKDLEIFKYFKDIHEDFEELELKHIELITDILSLKGKVVTYTSTPETNQIKAEKKGQEEIMKEFLKFTNLNSYTDKSRYTKLKYKFYNQDKGDEYEDVVRWIEKLPKLSNVKEVNDVSEISEVKEQEITI